MALRVVVAEDEVLLRDGIVRLLSVHPDIEVVGTASTLDQLLALTSAEQPDVVITDIRMPPTRTDEGIRAATILRQASPAPGVVVLTQHTSPAYAAALLEQGSAGRAYLLKERVADVDQLAAAVRTVAGGGSVIDPAVVDDLFRARARVRDSVLRHLTPREREVLEQVAQGKSNAAVAGALQLSERAVEKHVNSMLPKLGLPEERDTNRRVKAVLLFLAETGA